MSRYEFAGLRPDTLVSIGWDRPLLTFFVQVIQTTPPPGTDEDEDHGADDRTILWIGTAVREIPYAADAIRVARVHAALPGDIGVTLEMDRLRTVADSDGPAQRAVRPLLSDKD